MFDWLFRMFERDRNILNEQQLAALISGLHRAASASLDVAGEQHSRLIEQYFSPLKDGTMKPKMVRLQVDEKKYILVPLISMVPPISFRLDVMRMRFSVKLAKLTLEALQNSENLDSDFVKIVIPPHSYKNGQRKDFVDIILEFKAGDPPQAVRHLLDTYSEAMTTYTKEEGTDLPPMDYAETPAYKALLKNYRQWQSGKKTSHGTHEAVKGWFNKIRGTPSTQGGKNKTHSL